MSPNKVTKQKRVAPPKKSLMKSQATEFNLRFLWVCLQLKDSKLPNCKLVAEKLDTTPKAVEGRYYMLKKYSSRMEGETAVEASGQKWGKDELELESKELKKVKKGDYGEGQGGGCR